MKSTIYPSFGTLHAHGNTVRSEVHLPLSPPWGGLVLLNRMLDGMAFRDGAHTLGQPN